MATKNEASREMIQRRAGRYLGSLEIAYNRRLAISRKQRLICLVPEESQTGNCVAIFLGCPIPFVLRPRGDEWRLVGCCYVHGMMDGQALESPLWNVQNVIIC